MSLSTCLEPFHLFIFIFINCHHFNHNPFHHHHHQDHPTIKTTYTNKANNWKKMDKEEAKHLMFQRLREVFLKKKLLPFGHCPKVAFTPPPRFGHLRGNFRLSRLRKKHTTKNYLKTT